MKQVKSIKNRCYELDGEDKKLEFVKYEHYRRDGSLEKEQEFNTDGQEVSCTKYDEKGNEKDYRRSGMQKRSEYDRQGNLVKEMVVDKRQHCETTCRYGGRGLLTDKVTRDRDGELVSSVHYAYKKLKRGQVMIREESCRAGYTKKLVKRYNLKNRVTEITWYEDGRLYRRERYKYDPEGRVSEEVTWIDGKNQYLKSGYNHNGHGTRRVFTYDGEGNHAGTVTYSGSRIIREVRKTYNTQGKKVLKESREREGRWEKEYEHFYNEQGERVKSDWYLLGELDGVSEYNYEYY